MFSRFLLKHKKLDKFDSLDKYSNKIFHDKKWKFSQSFLSESILHNKISDLTKILFFEWICNQKSSVILQSSNKDSIIIISTLRGNKLFYALDLFFNSLFLSNQYKTSFNSSTHLIFWKNSVEIDEFLFHSKIKIDKLSFNNSLQPFPEIKVISKTFFHC